MDMLLEWLVQGLQQHAEASHSLLQWSFPDEPGNMAPSVAVRCDEELLTPGSGFCSSSPEDRYASRKVPLPLQPFGAVFWNC